MADLAGWFDISSGVAGDMLMAALIDAGASLEAIRAAVDTVIPGQVTIDAVEVHRAGQRAINVQVSPTVDDPAHRSWKTIRTMLLESDLHEPVRVTSLACFEKLATAEGRVHGVTAETIHFHEVGALDAIADVVGVAAAVSDLQLRQMSASAVALGSGRITAAHGSLPVPVPAVTELAKGWPVTAPPADTELATPTGMALVRTLCPQSGPLAGLTPERIGVGAGSKDFSTHPNVVRLVLGPAVAVQPSVSASSSREASAGVVSLLESTVDDMAGELWPGAMEGLLRAGAIDVWLLPALMKKARPGHVLQVLCRPEDAERLAETIMDHTSTFGVRLHENLPRLIRGRMWETVQVRGQQIRVKLAHDGQRIRRTSVEFEDLAVAARELGLAEIDLHTETIAEMTRRGLVAGAQVHS